MPASRGPTIARLRRSVTSSAAAGRSSPMPRPRRRRASRSLSRRLTARPATTSQRWNNRPPNSRRRSRVPSSLRSTVTATVTIAKRRHPVPSLANRTAVFPGRRRAPIRAPLSRNHRPGPPKIAAPCISRSAMATPTGTVPRPPRCRKAPRPNRRGHSPRLRKPRYFRSVSTTASPARPAAAAAVGAAPRL